MRIVEFIPAVYADSMLRMIVNWILTTVALLVVAHFVPGFHLNGLGAALWAAVVIGFVNATLGTVLKVLTFPLTLVTLGIFWVIINAIMLEVASAFSPNFRIDSFKAAFIGAIALSVLQMVLRWLFLPKKD